VRILCGCASPGASATARPAERRSHYRRERGRRACERRNVSPRARGGRRGRRSRCDACCSQISVRQSRRREPLGDVRRHSDVDVRKACRRLPRKSCDVDGTIYPVWTCWRGRRARPVGQHRLDAVRAAGAACEVRLSSTLTPRASVRFSLRDYAERALEDFLDMGLCHHRSRVRAYSHRGSERVYRQAGAQTGEREK
jgi:hypothetical protein